MMEQSSTVAARIDAIAAERGETPAVIGLDEHGTEEVLSWRELAVGSRRVADLLRGTRVEPPARAAPVVAIPAGNTPSTAVRLLGALVAELPVLPLDPRAPEAEQARLVEFVTREHGPVQLLTDPDRVAPVTRVSQIPQDTGVAGRPRPAVGYLLATGGSSGLTKVVATPGPVRYDPGRVPSPLLRRTGWRSGQRQLVAGPLHHTAPFTHWLTGVLDGHTVVLLPAFAPDLLLESVRRHSIEWLQLTPAHLRSVVQLAEPDPADLASVHAVVHTAAACDFATKKAWLDLAGPHRVFETYGSTEDIGVTLARGDEWLARPGTVGKGFLTQIRILDEAGKRLPAGEVGTVYMRSARMSGRTSYLGGLRMATTPDGFASVGDHGWLDEDGYLFLAPRRVDLINVGGENVYPAEVEAAILEHPAVLDTVVVGAPDPVLGSVVHARVVPRNAARVTRTDLIRHCATRLSPYKVPRRVSFVATIPRSTAGKLERWRMRDPGRG
jgi:bile acid-coenzyme A ligase